MNKRSILRNILIVELLLLVPVLAMLFSVGDWDWNVADFIIVGILLAGIGIACQLIVNGVKHNSVQAVIGIVMVAVMLLIWAELAVGIFTDWGS